MKSWKDKRVLVTGGTGFIGSHLVERLVEEGARVRVVARLKKTSMDNLSAVRERIDFVQGDLTDLEFAKKACEDQEVVFNLAAKLTGPAWNKEHSGDMFYKNAILQLQVLEAARQRGVERFLVASTPCVYPDNASIPTPESEGFLRQPERANLGYGWAKRLAEAQALAFTDEYPIKVGIVRPYNTYGPRDDFAWDTSHVIPALIRKAHEWDELVVWGDGRQTRSFIHADDVARGMMLSMERYPEPDPINLGSDEETLIRDLTYMILEESGIDKEPVFDTSKPSGAPRRKSENTKARDKLGFSTKISLREGLRGTIEWYRRHRDAIREVQLTGADF